MKTVRFADDMPIMHPYRSKGSCKGRHNPSFVGRMTFGSHVSKLCSPCVGMRFNNFAALNSNSKQLSSTASWVERTANQSDPDLKRLAAKHNSFEDLAL